MRPLTSRSLPIDGMLALTFVSRRGDQNPASIVTACTGTLCSFALGDLAKFRIPWSRQAGVAGRVTDSCPSLPEATANPLRSFGAPGKTEIAEADIAEVTNFLREHFFFPFTGPSRRTHFAQSAHIIAQARPRITAVNRVLLFQYAFLSTLFLQNSDGTELGFPVVFCHRMFISSRSEND
jgi:hypothetical protein